MSINGGCLFMKILITGFEPFGGYAVNPSSEAVGLLPDQIDGTDIIKKVLPVVFGDAADQLTEMIRETVPDAVICTGLAAGRKGITPELIAVNIRDARIPDNAGRQPEWEKEWE
jgi:pyroglutamyl-peptidase